MEEVNQKKKMLLTGIIITVIVFFILLIILMVLMGQENAKTKFKMGNSVYKTKTYNLQANDVTYQQSTIEYKNQELPILLIDNQGNEYYCIETIAALANYTYNNGAYGDKVDESKDKCYIDNGGEYVTFISNSKEISKTIKAPQQGNPEGELKAINDIKTDDISSEKKEEADEESFIIDNPVIRLDDKLYVNYQGINKGLNMIIQKNGAQYEIFTLEQLVQSYRNPIQQRGYTLTNNFKNQRALASGYAVVGKDEKYGALAVFEDYKTVLSVKYDAVAFVQSIDEFLILTNLKFGMAAPGKEKLTLETNYDNIKLLSAEKNLYIVQNKNKFGVVNTEGKVIIPTEYDQIGLTDVSAFSGQEIKSKYIIADSCIPVKKNEVYGLYDLEGNLIANSRFIELGCEDPSKIISEAGGSITTEAMPTLIIPLSDEVTGIVFGMKNAAGSTTYGVITTKGTVVQNAYYTAIYYIQRNGKITYYFNKPSNREVKTLEELIRTSGNFKRAITQEKSKEEKEAELKAEQQELNGDKSNNNQQENDTEEQNNNGNQRENNYENGNNNGNQEQNNYDSNEQNREEYNEN